MRAADRKRLGGFRAIPLTVGQALATLHRTSTVRHQYGRNQEERVALPVSQTQVRVAFVALAVVTAAHAGDKPATAPSPPKFSVLREKCAKEKEFKSCFEVASALYYGDGAKQDKTAAEKIAADLCTPEKNSPWTCLIYAKSILNENPKEAVKWLDWACAKYKAAEACMILSSVYTDGELVTRDREYAVGLLETGCREEVEASNFSSDKALNRVNKWATAQCCNLSALTLVPDRGGGNDFRRENRFRRACDLGLADGCFSIANVYGNKYGDEKKADEWRQKGLALKREAAPKR